MEPQFFTPPPKKDDLIYGTNEVRHPLRNQKQEREWRSPGIYPQWWNGEMMG